MKIKSFFSTFIVMVALACIYKYAVTLENEILYEDSAYIQAEETRVAYDALIDSIMLDESEHDLTIMIDPYGGGDNKGIISGDIIESQIAMQIASYVKLLNDDSGIRIILTREGDTNPSKEQRRRLAEVANPDAIICVRLASDADTVKMGVAACYDNRFFNYKLTNVDLADCCIRGITSRTGSKVAGIVIETQDDYMQNIPLCTVRCGYISNAEEKQALSSDAYIQNIARGILDAIKEAYGREKQE